MSDGTLADDAIKIASGGVGVGGGWFILRWLVNLILGRVERRENKVDAEEAALDEGWKSYRKELEKRLGKLELQNEALRTAFHHVAGGLIRIDPQNPALLQAERLLAIAFPLDMRMVAEMAGGAIDLDDTKP